MGSTPVSESDSVEQRLGQTLRCLVEDGNHRGVVRLVERWAQLGGVTQAALIGQAKSFMALGLMDRAWVRLQEAREQGTEPTEVQLLTAEMFIQRGWPARARRILERISVVGIDRARLDRLRQAAACAPVQPPENTAEIERAGGADDILELAERYLAAGSFMRAEGLLERLLREGHGVERVADLLWGIRGEYLSIKQSTDELLGELGRDEWLSEWDGIEHTETLHAIEDTVHDPEAAARELLADSGDRTDIRPAFPNLFRREGEPCEDAISDEDEVTIASQMATMEQMGDAPVYDNTDPAMVQTGEGGDTRILAFITKDGGELVPAEGPIHRTREPRIPSTGAVGSTLDLRARSEGRLDGDQFLEEEDQDLIVMTRREPNEGNRRDRQRPRPASRDRLVTSETSSSRTLSASRGAAQKSVKKARLPPEPETDELLQPTRNRQRLIQLIVVTALVVVGLGVAVGGVLWSLQKMAGQKVIGQTHAVLSQGVYRSVQELEAKLQNQVTAQREPMAIRAVELALVRVFLWSDYSGDGERLLAARDNLEWAEANGAPPEEVALAKGFLHLAMGDRAAAHRHLADVSMESPLARELKVRLVLAHSQPALLESVWGEIEVEFDDMGMAEQLALEGLATALGRRAIAAELRATLLATHSGNPFVQLARFERGWGEQAPRDRLTQLSSVMSALEGRWSPRQEGRFHAIRARIMAAMDLNALAMDAWQKALIVDPTHSVYLYISAGAALWQNRVLAALDELDRCLGGRPWDQACRRGTIHALIDLDRLHTARQTVDSWRTPGRTVAHLDAWVSLAEGRYQHALDLLSADVGEDRGVGLWTFVQGMALTRLGKPEGDTVLESVVIQLAASPDPLDRLLAARAEAARMVLNDSSIARRLEAHSVEIAPLDPMVHVEIGQYFETHRRRSDARDAFELAGRVGLQNARAQHARGLFYYDPARDLKIARSAWTRYLDLQPDGERADRTRARMGRR